MKREYDFSKGIRGKFFRGEKPFQVTIEGLEFVHNPRFEVFRSDTGKYHFRLCNDDGVLLVSPEEFSSVNECRKAIEHIRQESLLAPTVFA